VHEAHDHPTHGHETPRESPWTIVAPLVVLATFAVAAGLFNLPFSMPGGHWLSDLLGQEAASFNIAVAVLALLVAGGGIAVGWFYDTAFKTAHDPDPLAQQQPGLFDVLNQAYSFDAFYAMTVGRAANVLAQGWNWLDRYIISRIVDGAGVVTAFLGRLNFIVDDTVLNDGPDALASGTRASGNGMRQTQTGRAQDYIGLVFAGIVVLALIYIYGIR
jgi:NADH-quinone oxidoreductase subunit L